MSIKNTATATVFGSTGLVGKKIVEALRKDGYYQKVFLPNRKEVDVKGDKFIQQLIDYDNLEEYDALFQVDHIFIALGTTIKKAGSQAQFRKVDLEYPTTIAKLAQQHSVKSVALVSSIGANHKSSNFYLKTKGETEKALTELLNDRLYIFRPSMLLGDREKFRLGEEVGKVFMKIFSFLMIGSLKKYRGIYDYQIANAMTHLIKTASAQKIFNTEEMKLVNKELGK